MCYCAVSHTCFVKSYASPGSETVTAMYQRLGEVVKETKVVQLAVP